MVVGLDYRDVELSVHDLLQELKTHPLVRQAAGRRRARRVGRQDDSRGRLPRAAEAIACAGLLICGDGAGLVNVPALKGFHYAIESGALAAEAAFASLQRGRRPRRQVRSRPMTMR